MSSRTDGIALPDLLLTEAVKDLEADTPLRDDAALAQALAAGEERQTRIVQRARRLAADTGLDHDLARLRDQIFALQHINDTALIKGDFLKSAPKQKAGMRIEAYDVAHLGGTSMVGVMTVIEDGETAKKEYRTFNIRGFTAANDTGALEEILSRRMRHTEWGMPDLVVADGGEAQLRVARQVLDRYQLKIPVVSVVKDERHKPKDILGDAAAAKEHAKDILLANAEAHRFSIRLHKNQRTKRFLGL